MAHDLPIFVAIDGSLDETGVATFGTAIIAPDIKDSDPIGSLNWLSELAKVLLIRSWRLPKKWGTNYACINMAESIGFILGEYTIPAHLPIIYITDSNNDRTLQRRVRHINNYTHRQRVRQTKQGIDYSIANHLELLTSKWPPKDQLVSIPLISALKGTLQGVSKGSPGRSRPRELGRYGLTRKPYGRTRLPEG
jgi:hypothetical protein